MLTDQGLGGVHKAVTDNGVSSDGEEVEENEDESQDGEESERVHDDPSLFDNEGVEIEISCGGGRCVLCGGGAGAGQKSGEAE